MTQPLRPSLAPRVALLLACLALACGVLALPAQARTILDRRALDALTAGGLPLPPPEPPGPPAPEAPVQPSAAPPPAPVGLAPAPPAPPAPAAAPLPTPGPVPARPEVPPPPIEVPVRPSPPAGPSHIVDTAPGEAAPLSVPKEVGLRLTFGAATDDLNPASAVALRDFANAAPPGTVFTVTAFAAGVPDDPSTPRRLSLSRALAVRGILLGQGIASTAVLVRSQGASMPALGEGPPDRVDVTYPSQMK